MQILGIDVGGTGIKTGLVDTESGELIGERERIDTPRPATPAAIAQSLRAILDEREWSGPVGVGFPAAIAHGVARTASNIDKSFIGLAVADYFSSETGRTVHVANDADVAGLAEMRFGAGKDEPGVVLIVTIGTGLGTAVFSGGHLLPNTELGHIYLDNGVEAERYAAESVRVVQKLKWKNWGGRLNRYLVTMEKLLWPDLIILGGGVSRKLHKFAPELTTQAPIVAASFLNQAGIVGAALFAEKQVGAAAASVANRRSTAADRRRSRPREA